MLKAFQTLAAVAALILCTTLASAASLPTTQSFVIAVGQTTAIYGVRGDCNGPAPSYAAVIPHLPKTSIGKFSDGGTGKRNSGSCKGTVNARVLLFTGTRPGKEILRITSDRITVQVK